jgi:hypothetical protein
VPLTTAANYALRHGTSPIASACWAYGPVSCSGSARVELDGRIGARTLRRAYAAGIIVADGAGVPDVHQQESGLWPDLTADEYLHRWITDGVAALDADARCEVPETAPVPDLVVSYERRLVCPEKAAFAADCVDALAAGLPMPTVGAKWCVQVQRRVAKHWRRGERAAAIDTPYDGGEEF